MDIVTVEPTFWKEGGSHVFVRTDYGRFALHAVIRESNLLYADPGELATLSLEAMVSLAAEVGVGNDREFDPTEEDEGTSDLDAAREKLLVPQHRLMADWLVTPGKSPSRGHRESFDALNDAYDRAGGDLFPGERELLALVAAGFGSAIRIGSKELCFNATNGEFFFRGPTLEWTAEEVLLFVMLVLSDEQVCRKFEYQDSAFLVSDLRAHRRDFTAPERELLRKLSEGEEIAPTAIAVPSRVHTPKVVPISSGTVIGPFGSFIEKVRKAGETAEPTAAELAEGLPEQRHALTALLVRHGLVG